MTLGVRIQDLLALYGPLTFAEIVRLGDMKAPAARSAIFQLTQYQTVTSKPTEKTGRMGRPVVKYALQEIA